MPPHVHPKEILEEYFKSLKSKIKLEILTTLFREEHGLTYNAIAQKILESFNESPNIAYHLNMLKEKGLISLERSNYKLTNLGKEIVEHIINIENLLIAKNKQYMVRTSKYSFEPFDPKKIEEYLIREGNLPINLAKKISIEVKEKLLEVSLTYFTAPLIREYINGILIEHGLEDYRHKLTRLGVPPYDIQMKFKNSQIPNPALYHNELGKSILEQYTLLNDMPQQLADNYLENKISLTNLEGFSYSAQEIAFSAAMIPFILIRHIILTNPSFILNDETIPLRKEEILFLLFPPYKHILENRNINGAGKNKKINKKKVKMENNPKKENYSKKEQEKKNLPNKKTTNEKNVNEKNINNIHDMDEYDKYTKKSLMNYITSFHFSKNAIKKNYNILKEWIYEQPLNFLIENSKEIMRELKDVFPAGIVLFDFDDFISDFIQYKKKEGFTKYFIDVFVNFIKKKIEYETKIKSQITENSYNDISGIQDKFVINLIISDSVNAKDLCALLGIYKDTINLSKKIKRKFPVIQLTYDKNKRNKLYSIENYNDLSALDKDILNLLMNHQLILNLNDGNNKKETVSSYSSLNIPLWRSKIYHEIIPTISNSFDMPILILEKIGINLLSIQREQEFCLDHFLKKLEFQVLKIFDLAEIKYQRYLQYHKTFLNQQKTLIKILGVSLENKNKKKRNKQNLKKNKKRNQGNNHNNTRFNETESNPIALLTPSPNFQIGISLIGMNELIEEITHFNIRNLENNQRIVGKIYSFIDKLLKKQNEVNEFPIFYTLSTPKIRFYNIEKDENVNDRKQEKDYNENSNNYLSLQFKNKRIIINREFFNEDYDKNKIRLFWPEIHSENKSLTPSQVLNIYKNCNSTYRKGFAVNFCIMVDENRIKEIKKKEETIISKKNNQEIIIERLTNNNKFKNIEEIYEKIFLFFRECIKDSFGLLSFDLIHHKINFEGEGMEEGNKKEKQNKGKNKKENNSYPQFNNNFMDKQDNNNHTILRNYMELIGYNDFIFDLKKNDNRQTFWIKRFGHYIKIPLEFKEYFTPVIL